MTKIQSTDIWNKYQLGVDYLDSLGLIKATEECHRFYNGDQWKGLDSGGERFAQFNFINGIGKYKTAVVARQSMAAVFSSSTPEKEKVCELMNKKFAQDWELGKMDSVGWKIVRTAFIQGDSYIFYGTGDTTKPQFVSNTNVFFADEQNANLQEQEYILIYERLPVAKIKERAKQNKIPLKDIELITADKDTQREVNAHSEVDNNSKCASVIMLKKDNDGVVHIARSTQAVIYQKDTILQATNDSGELVGTGLKVYPILNFVWEDVINSARGVGGVRYLIPNQLELNKTLARRTLNIKLTAFARLAYSKDQVFNPEDLDKVGVKIGIKGPAANVGNNIAYLQPAQLSPDVKNFCDELITISRELAGAGDAATGQVDPTQASGAAIIAARDQAALPLNEQVAKYKQFVEDLSLLWWDIWVAYNPNGITVEFEENGQNVVVDIPQEELEGMKIHVRVDVSPNNPFSKFAREQALERLFSMQMIGFEEYIRALPDDSNMPKSKLLEIIDKRKAEQEQMIPQEQMGQEQMIPQEQVGQEQMIPQEQMGQEQMMQEITPEMQDQMPNDDLQEVVQELRQLEPKKALELVQSIPDEQEREKVMQRLREL